MSATITIEEAQAKLKELIHQLAPGEEVIITENQQPVAKLVNEAQSRSPACARPRPGQGLHHRRLGRRRTPEGLRGVHAVRLLLDTHAMYWYIEDDPQLSGPARTLIQDASNEILISPASYWEIAIKVSIGKWRLNRPYEEFIDIGLNQYGFRNLAHSADAYRPVDRVAVPAGHKDPFDRLLVAQALVEQISIVSADSALDAYGGQSALVTSDARPGQDQRRPRQDLPQEGGPHRLLRKAVSVHFPAVPVPTKFDGPFDERVLAVGGLADGDDGQPTGRPRCHGWILGKRDRPAGTGLLPVRSLSLRYAQAEKGSQSGWPWCLRDQSSNGPRPPVDRQRRIHRFSAAGRALRLA